jgi:hypothetical protein
VSLAQLALPQRPALAIGVPGEHRGAHAAAADGALVPSIRKRVIESQRKERCSAHGLILFSSRASTNVRVKSGRCLFAGAIRFLAAAFLKRYYELNEFYETNCIH